MKQFCIKIIIFLLPVMAIAVFMEISLRNIPNDYRYKREYLVLHSHQIETLILGSSHTFYGLNPDYFSSNTFNASHISQSIDLDYEILKKYQNSFQNLKTVILPISYFTFFENLSNTDEAWRIKNYTIYYRLNSPNSLTDYSEVLSNHPKINTDRLISYYVKNNPAITCSELGWGTEYHAKNAQNLAETGKNAAVRHTIDNFNSKENQKIFTENISTLEAVLEWCSKRNIKIYLVTPPAYQTYRENLNIEQLKATIDTVTEICSKHNHCMYDNLLSDDSFLAQDFYDSDHLSEIGAEKLSKFVNQRIQE